MIRLRKHLLPVLVATLLCGCGYGGPVAESTEQAQSIELTKEDKQEYIDRINQVMDTTYPNTPATERLSIESEVLFQMLLKDRGDLIAPTIDATDKEVDEYLQDSLAKNLKQKLILVNGDDTWDYFTYTDSDDSYAVGDKLLGYTIQDIIEPTDEERFEYARKSILAKKLVKRVENEVEGILR